MQTIRRAIAALLCVVMTSMFAQTAAAQSANATVTGLVVDQRSALPVSGATIILTQNGTTVASGTADPNGRYTIAGVAPGLYVLTVRASGYETSETDDLAVSAGAMTTVNASLVHSIGSQNGLSVIGRASTAANPLLAATTISQVINPQVLTDTGQIRVVDQLATLPAVNLSTSSSVGDDVSINLRGFSPDETAVLLDGHPVGPLGVGSGGFNFSVGPSFGLSQIDVTYGSGAQGLYGNDTIGGAVNLVTLSPTTKPQYTFQQQVGGFGIRSTGISATGMLNNRLGYAAAAAVLGEYGDFYPGPITQSARPDNPIAFTAPGVPYSVNPNGMCDQFPNDVSTCNRNLNTYAVSQNTEQHMLLGKLTNALSPATNLTATAYDAAQWSDSTGNGDNDYLPYSVRLGQVQQATPNCTAPGGGAGYTVYTNPLAGSTSCYTAQQYAAATYGPDGGGAGRQRGTRFGDYHLNLTTKAGNNTFQVDGYVDNYAYWKDSSLAGGIDAAGEFLGAKTYANFYNTQGYLVSDEITTGRNDFTLGYSVWHQLQTGNEDDFTGVTVYQPQYFGEWSYFARDSYQFNDRLSFFLNAWMKHSSVSEHTTFDPRATLQFHPSHNDVVQFTYGRSDGAPSPSLKSTQAPIAADPGASLTSVTCNGFNSITTAGNPALLPESANDFEMGYGHRFGGDSNIQINGYVTHVTDQLFTANEPLLQYGVNNVIFAPGIFQTYIQRLDSQCGYNLNNATVLQYLAVATTYNVASALARGIELTGRQRINHIAYVDYGYYIESSTHVGISNEILLNNATITNGSQLAGIPLHQATLSLDVAPGPWEFRLDNYYTEFNNPLNRPSYWHSNAFISRSFNHGRTMLTLGGTNIFNQAVQYFGYLGLGTTALANQYNLGTVTPQEEFGLAPAQLTLTLTQKY
jgi:hypothetical protein